MKIINGETGEIKNMDEILKEHQEHMKRICSEDEYSITLRPEDGGFGYCIPWGRIDTPVKILGWIDHLLEKNWVTKDHIDYLITRATKRVNLEIHPI